MRCVGELIARHWDRTSPLLLGYSGGPDSKSLLYALLDTPCRPFLHIAHVDHGWRPESEKEADLCAAEAQTLGISFHRTKIAPQGEAASREARLLFFQSLFEKYPFQALLLGHQANDLAETVLKRILEGAHLTHWAGMDPISSLYGMVLWRPLLATPKKTLEKFLAQRGLRALVDPSNENPVYLRARLRRETLPWLAQNFGKEIEENLLLHAQRSRELREYLDRKTQGRSLCQKGAWKAGSLEGLERIEARHLVRKWADEMHLFLSREAVEQILDFSFARKESRRLSHRVLVDKGLVLFALR